MRTGRPKSHGLSFTPTHRSWSMMKSRCQNRRDSSYQDYGGANPPVIVCERWQDFHNFLADMGLRPEGTTLGRHNDSGNYEPGNVSWQTKKQQSESRNENRSNYKLTSETVKEAKILFTEGWTIADIARLFSVDRSTVSCALAGKTWKRVA